MSAPLFSVITITYQDLDGLRRTVESVSNQQFHDFEHIVIDAGSTDGSGQWLADNFTGSWISEPDNGRYDGMNKGAAAATGRYLWFLHSGDLFADPTVLHRVARSIENAEGGPPDWLYGFARVVDPDKTHTGILGYAPFTMFNFAILQRPLPHQASAIKRTLFWQLGGYDEEHPVAADQVLMMAAANVSAPLAMADFLCDFDSTGISANRPWKQVWRDDRAVLRRLDHPVTRSRTTDLALTFAYSALRQAARTARARMVVAR